MYFFATWGVVLLICFLLNVDLVMILWIAVVAGILLYLLRKANKELQ
jgi:hypothetical protein